MKAALARIHKVRGASARHATLREITAGLESVCQDKEGRTPEISHEDGLEVLRGALQSAITLEFATIPPYMMALWSIEDELDPVARSIREVVQEEMLHMALACNMLSAIGGTPSISGVVPDYPGHLPHGVHPELVVSLQGLGNAALETFLEIERPALLGSELSERASRLAELAEPETLHKPPACDQTIGQFYDGILAAFRAYQPELCPSHQITGPLAWKALLNVDDVAESIGVIQRQGEGSQTSPADAGKEDLAHFYRFLEIYHCKKLERDPDTGRFAFGRELPRPRSRPVAPVPQGGYPQAGVPPEVWRLIRGFDLAYSELLDLLQRAWEEQGGQAHFWRAIEVMFRLERYAKPLMEIPLPTGKGTYGPCFRYIAKEDR